MNDNKVCLSFDSAIVQEHSLGDTDSETFCESLVQVIEPVREAMYKKCDTELSYDKIDNWAQIESVPIELLSLVNFLQDGIDLSNKGFSRESLTMSQIIILCTILDQVKNERK